MEQWSFNDVVPFNLIVGVYKKRQTKNATTRFAKLSWAFALFLHTANEGHNNNQSNNDNNYLSS